MLLSLCLQSSHPINASYQQGSPPGLESLISPGSSLLDVSPEAVARDLASSGANSPAAAAHLRSSADRSCSRLSPLRGSSGGLRSSLGLEQHGDSQPGSPGAGSSGACYVYDRDGNVSPGGAGYLQGSTGRMHGSQSLGKGARDSGRPWHGPGEKFSKDSHEDPLLYGQGGVMELPQQEPDWEEFIERQQHFLDNKEWKVSLMRERQAPSEKPKVRPMGTIVCSTG
jgi:hypothetical protein